MMLSTAALSVDQTNTDLTNAVQLFKAKRYEKARALLQTVLAADGGDAEAHYYLGRTYFELCEYNKAVRHSKKAVELESDNADHHFWLGRTYGAKARQSNRFKQALLAPKIRRAFERAVALNPKHIGGRTGLGNFYLQAPAFMGGDINKAYVQARVLIELAETGGRVLLARVYEKDGEPDLAEVEYKNIEEALGESPDAYQLFENYGRFLLKRKRYHEAIEKFKKQLALAPDKGQAHSNLGDAYKAAGRSQDAADEYRRASAVGRHCGALGDKPKHEAMEMEQSLG